MKRIIALLAALAVMCMTIVTVPINAAVNMINNSSQNEGMFAVPAPGEVVIDGEFKEWDWSGRIKCFADLDYAETHMSETAAMWDTDNLYLGFDIKDPTPMQSVVDPIKDPSSTWKGDAIQLRMITDRTPIWVTISYFPETETASFDLVFWGSITSNLGGESVMYTTDSGGSKLTNYFDRGEVTPLKICTDAEIKYKEHEDGLGYNIEIKIPWKMLYHGDQKMSGGEIFTMGIENYWNDSSGANTYEYSWKDNVVPNMTKRHFFYTAVDAWGTVTLLKSGNITPREYIPDPKVETGSIKIRIKVPKNANWISVTADNKSGERVSNIVSELELKDYIVEEYSDYNIAEIYWDGKDCFGNYVSPGKYVIKGITYENVEPFYDTYFYNPGTTPWPNSTGSGEWGADHVPPISVAAGGNRVYCGWPAAEGGHGLIALDENGEKMWGINRSGKLLAANDKYVYAIPEHATYHSSSDTGNMYLMRLEGKNGEFRPFVTESGEERNFVWTINSILGINATVAPKVTGLTANNSYVALATVYNNDSRYVLGGLYRNYGDYITVLNAETGSTVKKIALENVGDIEFSPNGMLYAISGKNIVEINPATGTMRTTAINKDGKATPSVITVDKNENVVIFDKGDDMQLKAYDPKSGTLVYTAAQQGGRALVGTWEEEGLTEEVSDIAVDYQNQIWAVEYWNYPRRYSVWSPDDGKLIKDYIGNAGYMSAGSALHDTDPNRAYTGAVEMELDRETQIYKVTKINWVPDITKGQAFPIDSTSNCIIQHFTSSVSGEEREYIYTNAGNQNGYHVLYMEEGDKYRPVFAMGCLDSVLGGDKQVGAFGHRNVPTYDWIGVTEETMQREAFGKIGTIHDEQFFIWNDLDGDASFEYEECEFLTDWNIPTIILGGGAQPKWLMAGNGWGSRMTTDFRFIALDYFCRGYMITPDYISESGAPVFSKNCFKKLDVDKTLFFQENILLEGTNKILSIKTGNGGNTLDYVNGLKLVDLDKGGKDIWWYKNQYPGVHGSHYSPVQPYDGTIIGPLKIMGYGTVGENQIFAIRGNMGCDYLMTTDGYYIKTLFRDSRLVKSTMADSVEEMIGKSMATVTGGGEPFSGWFGVQSDGVARILTSAGARGSVVAKIEGLDTVKRFEDVEFTVTLEMIENQKEYEKWLETQTGKTDEDSADDVFTVSAKNIGDITVDGETGDWLGGSSVEISVENAEETGHAKLSYDSENLYMLYQISDSTPMVNAGQDIELMHKTGDCVDLMLSPTNNSGDNAVDGDMRILISEKNGEPIVVLSKTIDSSADGKHKFVYSSPVTTLNFDTVKVMEDAEVVIKKEAEGYIVEARLPLASLGIMPTAGGTMRADFGIITSDPTGTKNAARIYAYNKNTGLTTDIPGETILRPSYWQKIEFGKASE